MHYSYPHVVQNGHYLGTIVNYRKKQKKNVRPNSRYAEEIKYLVTVNYASMTTTPKNYYVDIAPLGLQARRLVL